jgi:hypothetical protein
MKQPRIKKTPKDRNIYNINGFSNYTEHHNERKDAGTTPLPTFLQKETTTILNDKEKAV